jgi:hypothetical protein
LCISGMSTDPLTSRQRNTDHPLIGQCLNYACTDVTPTPGLRKRVDFPAQQVIQKRLCPKGFEPCPLYPKGYEVRLSHGATDVILIPSRSASTC